MEADLVTSFTEKVTTLIHLLLVSFVLFFSKLKWIIQNVKIYLQVIKRIKKIFFFIFVN